MVNISKNRHPKEKLYLNACMAIGALIWFLILIGTAGVIIPILIIVAIISWFAQKMFRVRMFGNSLMVTEQQLPEIHNILTEISSEMKLSEVPETFVINSDGVMNAFAVKFLQKKYVLLNSALVDLMIHEDDLSPLKMIIAHELSHHVAGHVNFWRNLLILPSQFIPFLGSAYSRSCEMTADRLAAIAINDKEAAKKALVLLAGGSDKMSTSMNTSEFIKQEQYLPFFFTWVHEIYSSHPRLTRRVKLIETGEYDDAEVSTAQSKRATA